MFARGFCVDLNPDMRGLDPTPDVYVAMRVAMVCKGLGWYLGQRSWLGRYPDGAQGMVEYYTALEHAWLRHSGITVFYILGLYLALQRARSSWIPGTRARRTW